MEKVVICLFFFSCAFLSTHSLWMTGSTAKNETKEVRQQEEACVRLDVAYIPQNDTKSCATTSVAMIISYYEDLQPPLDKETVWHISGTDEAILKQYGNDMEGLRRIATHYGYHSQYIEHLDIEDVERFVSNGMPVMLNITCNTQTSMTHAILVVGYNNIRKIFYIRDPASVQNTILEYADLESRWSAHISSPCKMSYRSGFVIYPRKYEL